MQYEIMNDNNEKKTRNIFSKSCIQNKQMCDHIGQLTTKI